jgi:hypothetical protein
MVRRAPRLAALLPLLAGLAVACAADPGRLNGEPVTAPVACVEIPPPTPAPAAAAASTSTVPTLEPPPAAPADRAPSTPAPSDHSDPCDTPCTGDTVCWVYVHRSRSSATAPAMPADGGWPTTLFDPDDDAGISRRETHCLPSSSRCPPDANGASARVTVIHGVVSRWNTCTWYDGP